MALTIGQKSERVLRFLRGLSRPRVAGALAAHGFTQQELDEGWERLRKSAGAKLSVPTFKAPDPSAYERLDEWENHWFPIAQASLQHRFPAVAEQVFLNLKQTTGLEVSVSVGTFVTRIRALQKSARAEDKAATELLTARGLNDPTIQQAEGLLKKVQTFAPALAEDPTAEDLSEAEARMWSWYLEWSTIARRSVHNRRDLRALGFLSTSGSAQAEFESDEADEETAPATPVAAE